MTGLSKLIKSVILINIILFISLSTSGQQMIEDIGHGVQIGLPLSALTISIIKGDKKGSLQLIKSFAVETVIVAGMKRTINRMRPNGRNHSFPSGHTAVSFMTSTYLWKRYGRKWGIPSTLLAGFVGYSRAGTDDPVHYYSDVIAGAALGIASSLLFTKSQKSNMEVEMIGDTSFVGVRVGWKIH